MVVEVDKSCRNHPMHYRTSMGRFYDTPDFIPVAPESLGYNEDKAERNEALLYVIRKLVNRAYDPMDKK